MCGAQVKGIGAYEALVAGPLGAGPTGGSGSSQLAQGDEALRSFSELDQPDLCLSVCLPGGKGKIRFFDWNVARHHLSSGLCVCQGLCDFRGSVEPPG